MFLNTCLQLNTNKYFFQPPSSSVRTRKPVNPLGQFINIEICLIYLQFFFALIVDPFRHPILTINPLPSLCRNNVYMSLNCLKLSQITEVFTPDTCRGLSLRRQRNTYLPIFSVMQISCPAQTSCYKNVDQN